jgi:hypothetical protein
MHDQIAIGLLALLWAGSQIDNCAPSNFTMKSQLLIIEAKCRGNDQCLFEGKDLFLDISIINNQEIEIGFPLEYVQAKGPTIKLIDTRTQKETYLKTNPPPGRLLEKFTLIQPGKSVAIEWVITSGEIQQFGGDDVDLSAEITIMTVLQMSGEKVDFRGSDTLRILSKDKP